MQDLNDLFYFTQVVQRGGFSAASRVLHIPKSRLSRRIARLEERLGVRLLQRTTRQLALTEVGEVYYRHCLDMVMSATAAQAAVDQAHSEPQGLVHLSCPVALAQTLLIELIAEFMRLHPKVWIRLKSTYREVNLIEEGMALSIRAHLAPPSDSGLVARYLGNIQFILVASPDYLARRGRPAHPEDVKDVDWLYSTQLFMDGGLQLTGPEGAIKTIAGEPKIAADDLMVLKRAAVLGAGIAALPRQLCTADLEQGLLETVLPDWALPKPQLHVLYPSRRGMVPAIRSFIDFIVKYLPEQIH